MWVIVAPGAQATRARGRRRFGARKQSYELLRQESSPIESLLWRTT
jgi:hypothetical protein